MSVSSVSSNSSSIWWEEYLEKQKRLQQQAVNEAAFELQAAATEKKLSVAAEGAEVAVEKAASTAEARPVSVKLVGPSGMSGGTSASIKWIEALVEEEEEEEDDDELSLVEDLAETLEEYIEELEEIDEAVNQ